MKLNCLQNIVESVIPHLNENWRIDKRNLTDNEYGPKIKIIGNNGKVISFSQHWKLKDKLAIAGVIPDFGLSYNQRSNAMLPSPNEAIKVSPNRKPTHIANDIERRLIPAYEDLFIKAKAEADQYKNKISEIEQVEYAFKTVSPPFRGHSDNPNSTYRRYYLNSLQNEFFHGGTITLSSHNELSCNISLTEVSPDKAIQILALLSKQQE